MCDPPPTGMRWTYLFSPASPTRVSLVFTPRQIVLITGSLLVIAIASATGTTTRAAASDVIDCFSPLEVVGLDNCPELKPDGGVRNNSIVEKLLAAKADMLRQVCLRKQCQGRPNRKSAEICFREHALVGSLSPEGLTFFSKRCLFSSRGPHGGGVFSQTTSF